MYQWFHIHRLPVKAVEAAKTLPLTGKMRGQSRGCLTGRVTVSTLSSVHTNMCMCIPVDTVQHTYSKLLCG